MADVDLMGLGDHCSLPSCGQVDFLPFSCDCCSKTYCLEHRSYAAHSCPAAGERLTEVIVCPLCAKGVKLNGRDPHVVFDEHQRQGCDTSNYAKVHKKPRCPVQGCKEKLSTINTYACKNCSQRVCLKHRDGDDHGCAAARASQVSQRVSVLDRLKQPFTSGTAANARPPSAPPARPSQAQTRASAMQQYADPSNSVAGTAARRRMDSASGAAAGHMVSNPVARAPSPPVTSNANPYVPPHLPEVCPQCNARFATVDRLVTHVEDYHPVGGPGSQQQGPTTINPLTQASSAVSAAFTSGAQAIAAAAANASAQVQNYTRGPPAPRLGGRDDSSSSNPYRCPHCSRGFQDAVLLVGHVDGCAAAAAGRGRPVASAGGGQGKNDGCCLQ